MKTFQQFYEGIVQNRQNSAQETEERLAQQKRYAEFLRQQQQTESENRAAEAAEQEIEDKKERRLKELEQKLNRQ